MLQYFIPLIASFLDADWMIYWFFPYFAGYIVLTAPGLLRAFTRWR